MTTKGREPKSSITKEEMEEVIEKHSLFTFSKLRNPMSANFAADRHSEQETSLPNTITTTNVFKDIDRALLRQALLDGELGRRDLITFSKTFFQISGEYKRLVQYFGNLLPANYVVVPGLNPGSEEEGADSQADVEKIYEYVDSAAIKETSAQIGLSVVLNGGFYGVERVKDDKYYLQELPAEYCRSTGKVDGLYTLEFDMSFFDQFDEEELQDMWTNYPDGFEQAFSDYKADSEDNWHYIPIEEGARVHKLDNGGLPLLAPVMLDILELDDYKIIEKTRSGLEIYKLLIQKIPTDPNTGEITLAMQEIVDLHENLRDKIENEAVDVLTTPAEVESIDLADKGQRDTDNMEKALNMVYTAAGTPMLLFNSGGRTGTSIDRSIIVDEGLMLPLLDQYTRWYNVRFEREAPKANMNIIFPPVTIFNREKMVTQYLQLASQGLPTKTLAATCLNISPSEFGGLIALENEFMNLTERMEPLSLAGAGKDGDGGAGQSSMGHQAGPGRPPMKDDSQLSEEGRRTRENDKNTKYKGTQRQVLKE